MDTANPALRTPDWLQVNLAIHLGRSQAVYKKKAVVSGFQQEERFWVVRQDYTYPSCTPGLTWARSFPSLCVQFLCQQKGSLAHGTHTSSYWGRARTLVFSCLRFPLAGHGFFCKLIVCSSLYYSMQGCPWKVSSFKLIMWSFSVSWHSFLITVGQFSSMLEQV